MLLLAACSTLNPVAAVKLQAIDFLNDDIGSIVLAIYAPNELVPVPAQSRFTITIDANDGTRLEVVASLVRAVTADISGQLPPPSTDRAYFLLEVSQASRAELEAFQSQARPLSTQNGGPGGTINTDITLKFCAIQQIDPYQEKFSAFVTLPGDRNLEPLVTDQNLGQFISAQGEAAIPSCAEVL